MVVVFALLALIVGAGVAGEHSTEAAKPTSLTITYWPDEQQPRAFERWTLRCNPLGGTLPKRRTACRRLARMTPAAFAPVPYDSVCTEIYGGPQRAVVRGTMGGKKINAAFRRNNGCQIDRWQRFSPWLFPNGGVAT